MPGKDLGHAQGDQRGQDRADDYSERHDISTNRRSSHNGLDDVTVLELLGLRAGPLKNIFHVTGGGSSEAMTSTGFGEAIRAVPTGVG
ncbi:hypothetical protein Xph01_58660 [Micromonospora phaseoli]|nr:hypothetical protein Xph01_58660 [Micromonospora phaseoli]